MHRPEARRSYESVIDVLLRGSAGRDHRGDGRCRRCSGSGQSLLLDGVYLYVLVTVGLHLRPVSLRARARPRLQAIAMPLTRGAIGIMIHDAEADVLVLRALRPRLYRGVVMMRATAATQSATNTLSYYHRRRGRRTSRGHLKKRSYRL